MEDVIKDLALAKAGDVSATKRILKRYSSYINYLIFTFQINNVQDCKDEVTRVLLNAIQKFNI